MFHSKMMNGVVFVFQNRFKNGKKVYRVYPYKELFQRFVREYKPFFSRNFLADTFQKNLRTSDIFFQSEGKVHEIFFRRYKNP